MLKKNRKLAWLYTLLLLVSSIAAMPLPAAISRPTHDGKFSSLDLGLQLDDNTVYFRDIGIGSDIQLQSPFEQVGVDFYLPLDWKPEGAAQLQMDVLTAVSSILFSETQFNMESLIAGTLVLSLNDFLLEPVVLQGNGERSLIIDIPQGALKRDIHAGSQHLSIKWDARDQCDLNLVTYLVIRPSSRFIIPHQKQQLPLDLTSFPAPLYLKNAAAQDGVRLVVPDQATAPEIQAALTVAAGMGRLTRDVMDLRLITASKLTDQERATKHLVAVGKAGAFPFLDQLIRSAQSPPSADDGVVEIVVSPWNPARAILVVTGSSDQALLKAAVAVSSGRLLASNAERTVSFVRSVDMSASPASLAEDQTFAALNQNDLTADEFGTTKFMIPFNIPQDVMVGADAYVDVHFNHSQLMEYMHSGIIVRMNGVAMGSIRLGDATSGYATTRLVIPALTLKPGMNQLEIEVSLAPRSLCSDPLQENTWITIFSTSLLHLPTAIQYLDTQQQSSLGDFPLPFSNDKELKDTLFVLPASDENAWQSALELVYHLGMETGGEISVPLVLFAQYAGTENIAQGNIIAIGRPDQLPLVTTPGGHLPALFDGSNALSTQTQERIQYFVPADINLGYLALGVSPADPGKVLLAILGNSHQGVGWAVHALLDPEIRKSLQGGNFAILQGDGIILQQLPLQSSAAEGMEPAPGQLNPADATMVSGETTLEPVEGGSLPSSGQIYSWVIPSLLGTIVLSLLVAGIKILALMAEKRN